mmetsp:Transcript_1452/g.1631  ORF Transcript_1452/g.1631 Transcript_1452/m.1631 type:complete len:88 (+) Transcript_1452:292-555(+)
MEFEDTPQLPYQRINEERDPKSCEQRSAIALPYLSYKTPVEIAKATARKFAALCIRSHWESVTWSPNMTGKNGMYSEYITTCNKEVK